MDLVAIGAHPDDVELFAGGFLAKAVADGYEVALAHLTRGERSTRGTPEERRVEAHDAARALGVDASHVDILDVGDTRVENTEENRLAVIRLLRHRRPRLVLYAHPLDRHPDHRKASRLVEDAFFYSHLAKIDTGQEPFRPEGRFQFFNNSIPAEPPSFIVDVTETFGRKIEALRAYRSQFHNPDYPGEETFISSRFFFEQIEARARYFGGQIGVKYGEPYHLPQPPAVADPIALLNARGD